MSKHVRWPLLLCSFFTSSLIFSQTGVLHDKIKKENKMIAVIFEVTPAEGRKQEYLDIAKSLRHQLDSIDGFISIERFESLYTPGKILSLSFWRDEEAITQWRNTEDHRLAQEKGRHGIFKDYRLRIAGVIRDYGMFDRKEAPSDSKQRHDKMKP